MPTESWQVAAAAALVGVLAAYADLLARLRRHERARGDAPGRWFGYTRDAVNLGAAALLWAVFVAAGFSGPQALLLGVAVGLFAYIADFASGRWLALRSARLAVVAAGAALGLPALLAARSLRLLLDGLLAQATALR